MNTSKITFNNINENIGKTLCGVDLDQYFIIDYSRINNLPDIVWSYIRDGYYAYYNSLHSTEKSIFNVEYSIDNTEITVTFEIKFIHKKSQIIKTLYIDYVFNDSINSQYRSKTISPILDLYKFIVEKFEETRFESYKFIYESIGFAHPLVIADIYLSPFMSRLIDMCRDGSTPSQYKSRVNSSHYKLVQKHKDLMELAKGPVPVNNKAKITFGKYQYNNRKNTFDYITVELSFVSSYFDNDLNKCKSQFKTKRKFYNDIVIEKLKENTQFKKFGVPLNFLKVDKIVITNQWLCIYTLSLKIDSPEVEEITYTDPKTGRPV